MNTERLAIVAHHISELPPSRFDMRIVAGRFGEDDISMLGIELTDDCGTAGCIAGWACALFAPDRRPSTWLAADLLGLDPKTADELFFARGRTLHEVTPAMASRALHNLINEGRVQWH